MRKVIKNIIFALSVLTLGVGGVSYSFASSAVNGAVNTYNTTTSGATGAYNTTTSGATGAYNTTTSGATGAYNTTTSGATGAANTVVNGATGVAGSLSTGSNEGANDISNFALDQWDQTIEVLNPNDYGSSIIAANCNPGMDPNLDGTVQDGDTSDPITTDMLKSCKGQNIGLNEFSVKVKFQATPSFVTKYMAACLAYVMTVGGGPGSPYGAAMMAECTRITSNITGNGNIVDLKAGHIEPMLSGLFGQGNFVEFEGRIVGDKLCVLAMTPFPPMAFTAIRTNDFNEAYSVNRNLDSNGNQREGALPSNCVYMPPPPPAVRPVAPSFVSKSCIDYNTGASKFRWPDGTTRSFMGVVVQCVEDTMNNLFFYERNGETLFGKTQRQLQSLIKALLAMYIMFIGYKIVIERGGIKGKDATWIALKVGLVWFFAAGPGMTQVLPELINVSKNLSAMVMQAGAGSVGDRQNSASILSSAELAYQNARVAYSGARKAWALDKNNQTLIDNMEDAQDASDAAKAEYDMALSTSLSYGYNYCNFSPYSYQYTELDQAGRTVVRDMSYMRLWDSIDCKVSKYLGIGSDRAYPSHPKLLMIAIGSLANPALLFSGIGFLLFGLILVFIIFLVLVVVRIVHIYIIAFIVLILLTYISPLIIPLMLFEYTKSTFEFWVRQLMAYALQPILLFTFLAFLFSILDHVVYEGNYDFYPMPGATAEEKIRENRLITNVDRDGREVCQDESAAGCIYEKVRLITKDAGFGNKLYTNDMSFSEATILTWGMLKIFFACFLMYAVLGKVEAMSATLTNIGTGAASLSSAAAVDPAKIATNVVGPGMEKAGSALATVAGAIGDQTIGRAVKSARRSEIRAATEKGKS